MNGGLRHIRNEPDPQDIQGIVGFTLLGLDAAGAFRLLRPHLCGLGILARCYAAIGAGKHCCVDGVDIAIIVEQPITPIAALFCTPFLIMEAGGVQVQLYRCNGLIWTFTIATDVHGFNIA